MLEKRFFSPSYKPDINCLEWSKIIIHSYLQGDRRKFRLTTTVKKLASKTKFSIKLKKRQESIEADKGGYWVSFLDGLQRVIMFTPDAYVYKIAQRPSLIERTNISVTADLLAIGLSLVNDIDSKEVAYLGLTG